MIKFLPYLSKSLLPKSFFFFSSFTDPLMTAEEAYSRFKAKSCLFVDVRDPESFAKSHIPNSKNINEFFSYLAMSDPSGKKEMVSKFEQILNNHGITGDEHIVTYEDCLKTRFGASCRAYFLLKTLGIRNVNVLHGGYETWTKASYPVDGLIDGKTHKKGEFKVKWNNEFYADQKDVENALKNKTTVLIDVRDLDEWRGETSSPYGVDFAPRKGIIPGAIHVLWKELMETKDGITYIKEGKEVSRILEQKGVNKDQDIIVYCFKGARASNSLIALKRAGFKKVRNYFASWNEWSRNSQLAIASGE